jgi:RNA polymerase-binding transcription factor DksA
MEKVDTTCDQLPALRSIMPLTSVQRERLEQRLKEERAQSVRALDRSVRDHSQASEQEQSGDLSTMPFHPADIGTDTMDEELDASNATRMSRELAEIDAALERLYHTPDKFGICEDTGTEIPFERLLLLPWARTCREAEGSGRSRR